TVISGGQAPYNWALTSGSAGLPPGLSLSSNGVISGTPTQSGTFDNIVVQMTDSTVPIARIVDLVYSITIN
ncbi:MAG TPA: putative Ig domain-containing protein, partial [Candidatus Acidoferrales bacterium]|nr:putative Ig domain-containing protein [Candidatus Acidoferrales bacterium]